MTMHKALHLRDNVDRLYVSWKKKEEDLPALKIALTHRYIEDYIRMRKRRLETIYTARGSTEQ